MIKVLLLDLDGVLRLWDRSHADSVETAYGLPTGALRSAAYLPDRHHPALTGLVDHDAWQASVGHALAAEHGDTAHDAVRDWLLPVGRVDTEVLEVVREARESVRVVLLTNATSRLTADLEALGLADEVDAVVSSTDLGLAKPDPDAFSRMALRQGLLFSEIAYVDAEPANVAAAEILGIVSHRYRDVDGLREFLAPLLPGSRSDEGAGGPGQD